MRIERTWCGVALAGVLACSSDTGETSETGAGGGTSGSSTSGGVAGSEGDDGSTEADPQASTTSVDGSSSDGASDDGSPMPTAFDVGFDVFEITPSDDHLAAGLFLGGYGEPFVRGTAEGVHDPIFVRSVAIALGNEGFVLGVADLPGLGNRFTRDIRSRVATTLGIPENHVLIATTHSHASPDFQGLWGGVAAVYETWVIDNIVASFNRAWLAREPAELRVASTVAPNFNRRDWGYTDDSLTVLDVFDLAETRLGTIAVFAAHPTILGSGNKDISRDWPGYTVDAIEAEVGAPVLLFNGLLGDVLPQIDESTEPVDDFAVAQAYGETIAMEAIAALPSVEPVELDLFVDHREWTLPIENGLFNLAATVGLLRYDFDDVDGMKQVRTQATYVRLGQQIQLIGFPGESLTRNGLAVREVMTAPHRMLLGQTGDALGYFVPADEWETDRNGNYEESVSLGQTAGDVTRQVLVGLVATDPG